MKLIISSGSHLKHIFAHTTNSVASIWASLMSERTMTRLDFDVFKNATMDIFYTSKEVSLYLSLRVLGMLKAHITWSCIINIETKYNLTTSH